MSQAPPNLRADIRSSNGGINILAEGNLAPTERRDENDKKIGINHDSLVITGLADIYQQGDMKEGKNTGPNYSYHQLNNQPKLTAKGDIKVSALGNRPLNQASNVYTDNNAVVINSADIVSTNGDVHIDAARGDLNLQAAQVAFMDGSQEKTTSRKWYGKKKTKITTKVTDNSNAVTTDINANNIYLNAESDIDIYGSQLEASPTDIIKATAGRELYFRKIDDRAYSETDIRKKSSWLGARYNKDHTNDTRQEITQLPVELVATMAKTKSGGNTVLEGTVFNTENQDEIQVGFGKYAKEDAKVIFDVVQHQISTTHNQERESTVWMKTVEERDTVTTADLPKFNQTPKITGPNGKLIDIKIPVDVDISDNNEAKLKIQHSQEALGKIALKLATQPGYEYLAELDKNNDINWVQVQLIQEHFKFEQEGLTPAAAALIAIAVSMATGGVGGAAGMGASITGTTGAMGAASTAAFSSLASKAAVTLINNQGDIGKTFKDMASSETIRGMATAALTAGVGAKLGLGSAATDPFNQKLVNAVGSGMTDAFVNAAINGVSLEDALKNSLRSSLVDVFAAETFSSFVKGIDTNEFADNLAHKLVAAGVGCVSASAKKQDCDAGALGAAVGEMLGDYLVDDSRLLTADEEKKILDYSKMLAGSVALLTNVDVDTAANSASIAVKNNALKPSKDIRKFLGGAVILLEQGVGGLAGAAVSVGKIGEPFIHPIDTYEGLKQFANQDDKWIAVQLAVAYDLQTRADNYNMHAANGNNVGMGMESAINTLDALFIGASIVKAPSSLLSVLPKLKSGARVTYNGATYILKNGKIITATIADSALRPSVPWKSQIGAVGIDISSVNPAKRVPTTTPYASPGSIIYDGVATRVNIVDKATNFTPLRDSGSPVSSGFKHVVDGHFNQPLGKNRSVFTISTQELKSILGNASITKVPVTAMVGGQYTRTVNTRKIIGNTTLNEGGKPTTYMKIFTDYQGNLITAFPVKGL